MYNTGLGINIKDCLKKYNHPDNALTLHLMQGWPAFDLKLFPGLIKLIPAVKWIKSRKTWKSGPEYYGLSSFKLGDFYKIYGLTLVLTSAYNYFLTWITIYLYTVCPW